MEGSMLVHVATFLHLKATEPLHGPCIWTTNATLVLPQFVEVMAR